MPQIHACAFTTRPCFAGPGFAGRGFTGPGLAGIVLLLMLGGCSAIYDDTKGWANRVEASVLEAAHEIGKAPDAGTALDDMPEAVEGEKPDSAAAAAAPAQPEETHSPAASKAAPEPDAAPQGALAALGNSLMKAGGGPKAGPATAPTKPKAQDAMVTPPAPQPKPQIKPQIKPDVSAPDSDVAMVLHLASLRSEQAAKREWSDLQKSYPDNLGSMQAEITRTELGEKGTFYRVLAGPLPSRNAAKTACATLKQKSAKQYCQVMPAKPTS